MILSLDGTFVRFHAIVFTAFLSALAVTTSPNQAHAQAAPQTERVVPRFNNSDLLALSDREQRIWVSGAVEGLANALLLTNVTAGRCVLIWYADGSTKFEAIQRSARLYPDNQPVTIIVALSNRRCSYYNPH